MPSSAHHKVVLPELGLPAETLRVNRWFCATGGTLVAEDPLVEILSEGVSITLPAPTSGVLLAQLMKPGEAVRVGQSLAVIERSADEWD